MTGSPELGAWLRQQREDRYWSRIEMARRMIKVANRHDDTPPPCTDHLAHNIYRWEHGKVGPSERYRLYWCEATGITPDQFGIPDNAAGGLPSSPAIRALARRRIPASSR